MKNKGFTLIEIIVCLALLSTITISSIVIVDKKKNDTLKNINEKVSNAVDIYLNTKKDEDGDTYIDGINKGGQGLYINLKTLSDEGLIDKEIVNTLEKKENEKSEDLKILATKSISSTNTKECLGQIEYTFSWDKVSTPVYLCPKNTNEIKDDETNINDFGELLLSKNKLYELNEITDDNYIYKYRNNNAGGSGIAQSKENGILKVSSDDNYYYRGNVNNNYIVFNNTYDRNKNEDIDSNYSFRIVYFNKINNSMKIIGEKAIKNNYRIDCESDGIFSVINGPLLSVGTYSRLLSGDNNKKYFLNQEFCEHNLYMAGDNSLKYTDNCRTALECNNKNEYINYQKYSCEKDKIKEYKVGMLTIYELLMTGTFQHYLNESCNNMYDNGCYGSAYANMNFISEGDGTIIWPILTSTYISPIPYNLLYLSGIANANEYALNYGFLNRVSLNYSKACNNIRPTLLLNMNDLYIKSGSGLKNDPYVIDIKNGS